MIILLLPPFLIAFIAVVCRHSPHSQPYATTAMSKVVTRSSHKSTAIASAPRRSLGPSRPHHPPLIIIQIYHALACIHARAFHVIHGLIVKHSLVLSRALTERMFQLSRLPESTGHAPFLVTGRTGNLHTVHLPLVHRAVPCCKCTDHLIRKRVRKHLLLVLLGAQAFCIPATLHFSTRRVYKARCHCCHRVTGRG